jgi:hypothetical protein
VSGCWCFVGVLTPEGSLVHVRYQAVSSHEPTAAQEALDRVAPAEPWRVKEVHVFREPPATFYAKARTAYEAKVSR